MTRPLAGGWAIFAPADVVPLAELAREGARSVAARRRLSRRAAELVDVLALAAADARSAAGTGAVQGIAGQASCGTSGWITVEEAAAVLKTSTSYVRRLCRTGGLPAEKRGATWLVDADAVTARALDAR